MARLRLPEVFVHIVCSLPVSLTSSPFIMGPDLACHLSWLTPPPELDERRFVITAEDLGLRAHFCCRDRAFHMFPTSNSELEPGLCVGMDGLVVPIHGTADANTLFFQRRLRIVGDTEFGLIVKNWLDTAVCPAWPVRWQSW